MRALQKTAEELNSPRETGGPSTTWFSADLSPDMDDRGDLILSALAKMTDSITKAAQSRRNALCDEGNLWKHHQRVASGKLERSKEKLDSLKSELKVWEENLLQANTFQDRATSFCNASNPNAMDGGTSLSEGGGITSNNTET